MLPLTLSIEFKIQKNASKLLLKAIQLMIWEFRDLETTDNQKKIPISYKLNV